MRNIAEALQFYHKTNNHFPADLDDNNWVDDLSKPESSSLMPDDWQCRYFHKYIEKKVDKKSTHYVRLSVPDGITPPSQPQCFILIETIESYSIGTNRISIADWSHLRDESHHKLPFQLFQDGIQDRSKIVIFDNGSVYYPQTRSMLIKCLHESRNIDEFHSRISNEYKTHNLLFNTIWYIVVFLYFVSSTIFLFRVWFKIPDRK
jgi:hypothetical protein